LTNPIVKTRESHPHCWEQMLVRRGRSGETGHGRKCSVERLRARIATLFSAPNSSRACSEALRDHWVNAEPLFMDDPAWPGTRPSTFVAQWSLPCSRMSEGRAGILTETDPASSDGGRQSWRRACMGSIRAARRAGIQHANAATTKRMAGAVAKVTGSVGVTL
jgi:hypothetical protein